MMINSGEISEYDVGTLAGLTAMAFVFAQCVHGFLEWIAGKPSTKSTST
jgi:hypothetical protein